MIKTEKEMRFPLEIQLFAEDSKPEDLKPEEPKGDETPKKPTFEELLKTNPDYQSAFDKISDQAMATREAKVRAELEEAQNEATRLAKLSADERAAAELQKEKDSLAKREQEVAHRELKAQAIQELTKLGLPVDCVDFLVGKDAETTQANITNFQKSYSESLTEAVEKRIKDNGVKPGKSDSGGGTSPLKTKFNAGIKGRT